MTLRDRANRLADRVRAIASRPSIDERTNTIVVRKSTYAGGRIRAEGAVTHEDLEILPRPRVRELAMQEIASSGGRYEAGDIRVGPIAPSHTGGGYTVEQLAPTVTTNGVRIVYVLTGPLAGEYERQNIETARNHSWFLILRRNRSTP